MPPAVPPSSGRKISDTAALAHAVGFSSTATLPPARISPCSPAPAASIVPVQAETRPQLPPLGPSVHFPRLCHPPTVHAQLPTTSASTNHPRSNSPRATRSHLRPSTARLPSLAHRRPLICTYGNVLQLLPVPPVPVPVHLLVFVRAHPRSASAPAHDDICSCHALGCPDDPSKSEAQYATPRWTLRTRTDLATGHRHPPAAASSAPASCACPRPRPRPRCKVQKCEMLPYSYLVRPRSGCARSRVTLRQATA